MTSYKNLPIISRDGVPTKVVAQAPGQIYINTLDGSVYRAKKTESGWDWVPLAEGGGSSGPVTPPVIVTGGVPADIPASEAKDGYFYYFLGTDELYLCRVLIPGSVNWRLLREVAADPT